MKIFIIHYDKLINRKEKILQQMNKFNLDFEFISNHGKDKLTIEDRRKFKNLRDGEISVALHHIECYKRIVCDNLNEALILEDDVLLRDNFVFLLDLYIKQLPQNWNMLFIGDGCGLHINNKLFIKNQFIYKKENSVFGKPNEGATRCLDSYLINKKTAEIIVEKLNMPNYTILVPADFWMNCVIRNNNFNVYWAEPTIVTQGSEKGVYKSSLR